ncbi:GNAT family N-acetyltransferase [Membranihabitans maritimus]|uniref:GNAT family N-acetyltransferase n=1 Tax=Membranihabitans maritimus TaxID=2904244 RepID=UPI001F18AD22|nr:N-acetyltransferase [Membranihabitans maritimus]
MSIQLTIDRVGFEPITDNDLEFLEKVYRSTREEEISRAPWSEEDKAHFIHHQFLAQHTFYSEQFSDAKFDIIFVDGQKAGRLYIEEREDELRIIDIALLPAFRGQGWGTKLLEEIKLLAEKKTKSVGIHVEKNNPAMSLYIRLGFKDIEDKGVYQFMKWTS